MESGRIRRVCVFTGSQVGNRPGYAEHARRLGRLLAEHGIGLVYGGGSVGLMGVIADAALEAGAEVIGVIPEVLMIREVTHPGLTDLRVVDTMHERKALMNELSDAFIAMPGGFGTLDELFEAITWAQLGLHRKPIGILNIDGYYDGLLAFLEHAAAEAFILPVYLQLLTVATDPEHLLQRVLEYQPPLIVTQWITREQI
jgi:uncharacterized protein (TIGR00730 family)